jgi:NADP-dependent 3-hydroxy acid dehydrogenase YdfG
MNVLLRNNYENNHVVLIIEGTSGVGLSLVRLSRRLGFRVATFGKSNEGIVRLMKEFKHDSIIYIDKLDITDFGSVKFLLKRQKSIRKYINSY